MAVLFSFFVCDSAHFTAVQKADTISRCEPSVKISGKTLASFDRKLKDSYTETRGEIYCSPRFASNKSCLKYALRIVGFFSGIAPSPSAEYSPSIIKRVKASLT
ncbi:hypothetical protein P5V15_002327 [Pogonomyrmex californicus]